MDILSIYVYKSSRGAMVLKDIVVEKNLLQTVKDQAQIWGIKARTAIEISSY